MTTTEQASNTTEQTNPLEALSQVLPIADLRGCGDKSCEQCGCQPDWLEPIPKGTLDAVARQLYQPGQHVLVTGERGVGKSSLVQSLANAAGEIDFLNESRFLSVDCSNIGPDDSRACLETIFTTAASMSGLVLCLDGIDHLIRRSSGSTNKELLRAMVSRPGLKVIGIMSETAYSELIASDADMLQLFARVQVNEPEPETASRIAKRNAADLSNAYGLEIAEDVVDRAGALTATFVMNECEPARTVKLLETVCANVDFDKTQRGLERSSVEVDDIVAAISEKTGIPEATIGGEAEECDLDVAIRDAVTGQDEVVTQIASELRLVKAAGWSGLERGTSENPERCSNGPPELERCPLIETGVSFAGSVQPRPPILFRGC